MSAIFNVVLRVMPRGDEFDVELPSGSTAQEIIDEMIKAEIVPFLDPEGKPYVYELISKEGSGVIPKSKSLLDCGVKEGDTLYFVPKIVAGGGTKYDRTISLGVNILPLSLKIELEMPMSSTGAILKEQIFSKINLDSNGYQDVKIFQPQKGLEIKDSQELSELNISDGEIVILNFFKKEINNNEDQELYLMKSTILELLGLDSNSSADEILLEIKSIVELVERKKDIKQLVDKWIQELSRAETNKVLNEALKYCRQNRLNDYLNHFLHQSTRWNTIHKQSIDGIISHDNFMLELNKVNTAVINILFELEGR